MEDIGMANFSCKILSAVVDDSKRPGDPMVTFSLVIDGHILPETHQLRLHAFKTADFESLDIRCRCTGDRAAFGQALYESARKTIAARDTLPTYFSNTGWVRLNGQPVYVAGNRVIGASGWVPADQYALAPHLAGLTLEVNPNISEKTAARHIRQLCSLYPGVSDMLVASAVVAHLFSLFEAAGVRPRLTAYIVGPSMTGKTTLAKLIGQTYNRSAPDDPHLVNLISTTAAVHNRVAALSDCVCVLDDLFPGGTLAESRRREERLSEVIRTTGNGAAKEKMSGKQTIPQVARGVVFTTAEYPLTTFSTMARVVTLHMNSRTDSSKLSPLQAAPKSLSAFWFYFLCWSCGHHDELVEQIRSRFAELRQAGKRTSDMDRVADAHHILTIGMEILTDYMAAVEPAKSEAIRRIPKKFRASSTQVYRCQKRELEQLRSKADHDRFSKLLAELCFSDEIKEGKKKKLGKKYASTISHGLLYIRLEDLVTQAQQHFGDPTITLQAVSAELRRNGLLEMDKSSRSSKKVNGIRYLQVPVDRLEEFLPSSPATPPAAGYLGLNFPSNRSINPVDEILSSWG